MNRSKLKEINRRYHMASMARRTRGSATPEYKKALAKAEDERVKEYAPPVHEASGAVPMQAAFAIVVAALAVIAAVALETKVLRALPGEIFAGLLASFLVTPLTSTIDVAVSVSASGEITVPRALLSGALRWLRTPLTMLREPTFLLCWFVYIVTYIAANLITCLCARHFFISPVLPKLIGVTAINMTACVYKDARVAQLVGKTDERPFPRVGYILFFVRDLIANGSGFVFPPLVAPILAGHIADAARRETVAQLLVPALANTVTSPMHFLALSLYNYPQWPPTKHAAAVASTYVGATSSRILKGLAGFGLGGVTNMALRARLVPLP